jgi:capsule polysaccharide export protein KpsE/RkpR
VLAILAARWRTILVRGAIIAVVVYGASYLIKDKFAASAVLLPPQEEADIGSLLSGLAGSPALSRAFGLSNAGGTELYLGVLQSRTTADSVIARFDLKRVYHARDIENAERKLKARTSITTTPEEFVKVTVLDEDRQRAASMANAYIEVLDAFLQQNSNTTARLRRSFLDRRLAEEQGRLSAAEDQLRDFQVKTKLPLAGLDVAASGLGDLMGQKVSREVELGTLERYGREELPRAGELREEISEIDRQLGRIPPATTEGARLLRETKVQEKIVLVLTEERERARMMELRNITTVQWLDHARPPVRKAQPRRTLIAAGAFFVALMATAWLEWMRSGAITSPLRAVSGS